MSVASHRQQTHIAVIDTGLFSLLQPSYRFLFIHRRWKGGGGAGSASISRYMSDISAKVSYGHMGFEDFLALWLIGAPIILGRCPSLLAHKSESMLWTYLVCREKQERERERRKQTARARSTQCINNSDPVTSMSELLLRQNNVTAHAYQS
jgi:hypothetical protein